MFSTGKQPLAPLELIFSFFYGMLSIFEWSGKGFTISMRLLHRFKRRQVVLYVNILPLLLKERRDKHTVCFQERTARRQFLAQVCLFELRGRAWGWGTLSFLVLLFYSWVLFGGMSISIWFYYHLFWQTQCKRGSGRSRVERVYDLGLAPMDMVWYCICPVCF